VRDREVDGDCAGEREDAGERNRKSQRVVKTS